MCITFALALDSLGIVASDTRTNYHYFDGTHRFADDEVKKVVLAPCGWVTGTGSWTVLREFYADLQKTEARTTWPEIESLLRSAREHAAAELRGRGMDESEADHTAIFFLDEFREPGALFARRFDFRQMPPAEARRNGYYFSWPPDLSKADEARLCSQFDQDVNSPRNPAPEIVVACYLLRLLGKVFAEVGARSKTVSGTLDAGVLLRDESGTHRFRLTIDANRLASLSDSQIWLRALASVRSN